MIFTLGLIFCFYILLCYLSYPIFWTHNFDDMIEYGMKPYLLMYIFAFAVVPILYMFMLLDYYNIITKKYKRSESYFL